MHPRSVLHQTRRIATAALVLALGACSVPEFMSFDPQTRGNMVDAEQLKELVPGTSSRADVTSLLGSPTAKATFDDNTWIYIAEITRPVIGGTLEVDHQHVVVVSFNQAGIVRNIETKTKADAKPVQVVSRTTPSPGSDASILQQLLGNVGKFSPVAPTSSGGGGAPAGGVGSSGAAFGR